MSEAEDSGKSDLLIINEVIRGNTGAFAGIIKEYQQPIMRLALSYLKSREAAEDAVQEIFIRAYRSLRTFSLDKRFRPWLYSLAVNHLKSSYRKRLRRFAVDVKGSSLETPAYRDPQETAELHETAEEIRKAVRALPAGLREVTLLYYLEGLSISETSEALHLGVENTKSRLFRARKKLSTILASGATGKGFT